MMIALEEEFVSVLTGFISSKEEKVISMLSQFHRGRLGAELMGESNLLLQVGAVLSVSPLVAKIKELVGQVITQAVESVEVDLSVNLLDFNPLHRQGLEKRVLENVKGMTDDLSVALSEELMLGWREGEGVSQLKDRVMNIWDNGNMTKGRAEMIARTETNYMLNSTRLQAAKDSGVVAVKRWDAHFDARTGSDSKRLDGQTRLLDEDFYDEENDMYISFPPNRPNCRCRLDIVPV